MKSKPKTAPAIFTKGDTVRVTYHAMTPECVGVVAKVRRVFWAPAGGGQKAGWVCETTIRAGERFASFFEHLLEAA